MTSCEEVSTSSQEQVKEIVSLLVKAAKTYQMYLPNNRMFIRSLENVKDALDRFFDENDALTLVVREFELLHKGEVVYTDSDKHQSLAFRLYRDGIRLITFHQDVTTDELVAFFDALSKALEVDRIDDDLVTILWEKDLHGISYVEVTDIESGGLEASQVTKEASQKPARSLSTPVKWNKVADDVAAIKPAIVLTPNEIQEIQELTFSIHDDLFLRKVWQILSWTFETQPTVDTFVDLENALIGFLDKCLATRQIGLAADALARVRIMAETLKDDQADEILKRIIATRLSEENLRVIRDLLATTDEIQHVQCLSYLSRLNTEAVSPILGMFPVCDNPSSKQTIISALATLASESPECLMESGQDSSPEIVEAILAALETIGSERALNLAATFAEYPVARIRRRVASMLGSVRSQESIAALTHLSNDADVGVKRRALVSLVRLEGELSVDRLRRIFTSKEFGRLRHDSKMALLLTMRGLPSQAQGQVAKSILKVRPLIRRRDAEDTKIALVEIAHLLDPAMAEELLEHLIEHSSGRLRKAAQTALKRITNDK